MASNSGRVLIYGGKGALGSKLVEIFKAQSWWVTSVDLHANDTADTNILVQPELSWTEQEAAVEKSVEEAMKEEKLDAILCVAGGWAGGSAAAKAMIKNADAMWKQSVWPSTISARLANRFLKEGGTLVLPGAQPAVNGTPGMIGYGMAKAAVHHLVKSLAQEKSGMPANSFVAAILPVTLDTPMNRKFMPNADHSSWTKLETVGELLLKWSRDEERPANGTLLQLITKDGNTEYIPA